MLQEAHPVRKIIYLRLFMVSRLTLQWELNVSIVHKHRQGQES